MEQTEVSRIWPADQIEHWPIHRLKPYARNARTHTEAQVEKVAAAIEEWGWTNPILVTEDGTIIAGHARHMAAEKLGLDEVPVVVARGWTEDQVRAFVIADNQLALDAGWDEELLTLELGALKDSGFNLDLIGFERDELGRLLDVSELEEPRELAGADPDGVVPEAKATCFVQPGDIWLLGEHRILCGDSTNAADVGRVMAGEQAALCFTSPPYAQQRDYDGAEGFDWDDLMQGVFAHLPMAAAGQVLVNLGLVHRDREWQPYWADWIEWMRAHGWQRFGWYVWDQGPGLPGDWGGRLSPSFEFVFHFCKKSRNPNKIVPCTWAGTVNSEKGGLRAKDGKVGEWTHGGKRVQETRIPDNVLRITRHKARGIEVEHPAVFPVKLPSFIMEAYTDPKAICFEPFAGSGTTIIAGQETGRRVRAIEQAPTYVDVILRRWQELYPGTPPILDGHDRTYEAIIAERRGA